MRHVIKKLLPALGLLAFSGICSAATIVTNPAATIVSNGGFENGLTSWVMSGDSSFTYAGNTFPHTGDHETHIGAFGDLGNGYLTQTLATTAGADYTLSFWYGEYNQNDPYGPWGYLLHAYVNTTDPNNPFFQANRLTVKWNGVEVFGDCNFFTSDLVVDQAPRLL